MDDALALQGSIEVILEDKHGNIKCKERHSNHLSDGFKRYVLFDALNGGTLGNLLKTTTTNNMSIMARNTPSAFNVYVMSKPLNLPGDVFRPPYVEEKRPWNLDEDAVSFYSTETASVEANDKIMVPFLERCFFDYKKMESVTEWRKEYLRGEVASVCIGRAFGAAHSSYIVPVREPDAPAEWRDSVWTTNYLLEHSKNGTTIHKTVSATGIQGCFNLKTKGYTKVSANTNYNTNIAKYGGLVVGDDIHKLASSTIAGQERTAVITTTKNWKTATTDTTKDIVFTAPEGDPEARTGAFRPVMVHNIDTNMLEIFCTMGAGWFEKEQKYGFRVLKATVNPSTLGYTVEDIGVHWFAPGWGTESISINHFVTGSYFEGKYYLPVLATIKEDGTQTTISNTNYTEGIIIDKDFTAVEKIIPFKLASTNQTLAYCVADDGIRALRVNDQYSPYIFTAQVVSSVNLDTPIVKERDDVLRIIYRYRMA